MYLSSQERDHIGCPKEEDKERQRRPKEAERDLWFRRTQENDGSILCQTGYGSDNTREEVLADVENVVLFQTGYGFDNNPEEVVVVETVRCSNTKYYYYYPNPNSLTIKQAL